MDDKTLQALTALAEKLGTTGEYLWGVLLKQAPITGITNLAIMVALCAATAWAYRLVRRKTTKPNPSDDDRYPSAEWTHEVAVLAWGVFGLVAATSATIILSGLPETVAAFVNPEYWALHQIIK